jgi:transcriptional regulator with XRE-family HTH domain
MSPNRQAVATRITIRLNSGAVSRLNDQVRERLREEIARKGLSQRELADQLQWSQSRVAKLLTGRVELSLNDLEGFCIVLQLRPTEAVRDKGLEFCKELTPSTFRLFEQLERTPRLLDAFLAIANIQPASAPVLRRSVAASPAKKKSAKAAL